MKIIQAQNAREYEESMEPIPTPSFETEDECKESDERMNVKNRRKPLAKTETDQRDEHDVQLQRLQAQLQGVC